MRFLHACTVCYTVFLTLLLWLPDPRTLLWGWQPSGGALGFAHLITFSVLGFLAELGRRDWSLLTLTSLLLGYAVLTEIVQEMLPIRSFEIIDLAQDLAGLYAGIWCAACVRKLGVECGCAKME